MNSPNPMERQEKEREALHAGLLSLLPSLVGGLVGGRLSSNLFSGPTLPLRSSRDFSVKQMARHAGLDVGMHSSRGNSPNAYFMPEFFARMRKYPTGEHGTIGSVVTGGDARTGRLPADIAAHELGHSKSWYGKAGLLPKWMSRARLAGSPVAGLSSWLPLLALDAYSPERQDALLNFSSGLAGAASVPVLADEAFASRNALRIMRSLPAGILSRAVMEQAPGRMARAWGTYGLGAAGMVLGPQLAKWYLHSNRE